MSYYLLYWHAVLYRYMIFKSNIFITFLCKYFITVYTHLITTYAHSVASVGQIGDCWILDGCIFIFIENVRIVCTSTWLYMVVFALGLYYLCTKWKLDSYKDDRLWRKRVYWIWKEFHKKSSNGLKKYRWPLFWIMWGVSII